MTVFFFFIFVVFFCGGYLFLTYFSKPSWPFNMSCLDISLKSYHARSFNLRTSLFLRKIYICFSQKEAVWHLVPFVTNEERQVLFSGTSKKINLNFKWGIIRLWQIISTDRVGGVRNEQKSLYGWTDRHK